MKVLNYIKSEYSDFSKFERVFFLFVILLTSLIAFFIKDNIFSFISAVCGISYTILSGKGKVYSYYIGITGTFCYSYIAYKNGFFGNFFLYGFYFLPMQIIGIFKWKENLKKEKNEIIKTKLNLNEKLTYSFIFALLFIIFSYSLKHLNGSMPYFDSFCISASILGQILTVKRCYEQYYVWLFVNIATFTMWIVSYIKGSNCFSSIIMWGVYIFLAVYFLILWKKEINKKD